MEDKKVTRAFTTKEKNFIFVQKISRIKVIIRIEITDKKTGYALQGLKGLDYTFKVPGVIVPTYKVNVFKITLKNDVEIRRELLTTFNVTRDAWYYLGVKKDSNKHILLNREFIPDNYAKNLYSSMWIGHYPTQLRVFSSGADAFLLTRFGERKIPARPLATNTLLDGVTAIDGARSNNDVATDVMIHIGGKYEVYLRNKFFYKNERVGVQYLGGSYGCFAFIPENQIGPYSDFVRNIIKSGGYDEASNREWDKVCNVIKENAFKDKRAIQILLHKKVDEPNDYKEIGDEEIVEIFL